MNSLTPFLAALLLPAILHAAAPSASPESTTSDASPRVKINLGNSEWKFIKEDLYPQAKEATFDDSQWKTVGIPHSYNDSDTYVNDGSGLAGGVNAAFKGTVWYRKHFKLPESYRGKKIFVEFEGVNVSAGVYINGKFIPGNSPVSGKEATHVHGFIGFVVDVSDEVRFGDKEENVLAVRVANQYGKEVEGKELWYRAPSFGTSFAFSMAAGGIYDIRANGSDAGFVLATIVDEKGNWCALADDNITFTVTGPADYRGSYNFWRTEGKPVHYHSPGDPELQAEGGQMKVALRSTFEPGIVTVTASSPGLKSSSASFAVVPVSKIDQTVSAK